ncbi:MAG: hypothetical protein GF317_17870 [Candidatus Lokiarchaeota archaeon]|nr:hypothetical protein [Candidatus Lokiarchaeota archaeon]MBD3201381.1 hypothetical protein [Candidatus Lokiarchaeota archaeon]
MSIIKQINIIKVFRLSKKNKKLCIASLVIFSLIITFPQIFQLKTGVYKDITRDKSHPNFEYQPITSDYLDVNRILINNGDDWGKYDFIIGDGSSENPYIIQNVRIRGNGVKVNKEVDNNYLNYSYTGMHIASNANYTVRDCLITDFSVGIALSGGSSKKDQCIINVIIDRCGVGIYSNKYTFSSFNISRCLISNCKRVSVICPPSIYSTIYSKTKYGGYGIELWSRGNSTIEKCQIKGCSIGILTCYTVDLISNRLVNCGFWFDFNYYFQYNLINNTVNGKPLNIIYAHDNLFMSNNGFSQYGQIIFLCCDNLQLRNVLIQKSCSIGIALLQCDNPSLENIVVENQDIGFYEFSSKYSKANNLVSKNCNTGFLLIHPNENSYKDLNVINCEVPFYIKTPIINSILEIRSGVKILMDDYTKRYDNIDITYKGTTSAFSVKYLPEVDHMGYSVQFFNLGLYNITDRDPDIPIFDFLISVSEADPSFLIPGTSLFWLISVIIFGISIAYIRFLHKKRRFFVKNSK